MTTCPSPKFGAGPSVKKKVWAEIQYSAILQKSPYHPASHMRSGAIESDRENCGLLGHKLPNTWPGTSGMRFSLADSRKKNRLTRMVSCDQGATRFTAILGYDRPAPWPE